MFRLVLIFLSLSLGNLSCRLSPKTETEIPAAAYETCVYIQMHNRAPKGHVGGRTFGNYEQLLPKTDVKNERLRYREWDIYPKKKGENRGAERLVTCSDGAAYYTPDHYQSFALLKH